jgi:hypothetical protein
VSIGLCASISIQAFLYLSGLIKKYRCTGHWWFTPVILATQETEFRRIEVQSQPWEKFERPCLESTQYRKLGLWSGSRGKSTCLASARS